jgi:hypothetical protein
MLEAAREGPWWQIPTRRRLLLRWMLAHQRRHAVAKRPLALHRLLWRTSARQWWQAGVKSHTLLRWRLARQWWQAVANMLP